MRFFSRGPKPFLDPARGDPQAAELRKAAAADDWRPVEAALAATTDLVRREFLIDALARDTTDLRWVDLWAQQRPDLQTARTVWGACAVQYAFHIRTADIPQKVSSEQWRGFAEWLTYAEEQLGHATSMDPNDSAPWVALGWSAVGLGVPFEEARARWDTARRLNPRSELAALAYTTFVSPRWHGSAEMMWPFVRGLVAQEPEGSPLWSLVVDAHFEQWVADRMRGDARVHASRYFQQPEVQREINDAYAKYLGSAAKQASPMEPQYRESFAAVFYLMGARDPLRRELQLIGPGIQMIPWCYLGAPVAAYERVRESVGLR